jgi:hypothetical protein
MSRLGRLGAVILIAVGASLASGPAVHADHCRPVDNPDPIPGSNTTWCHTTPPTKPPKTPKPTPAPTAAPTAAPNTAAPGPVGPAQTSSGASTPEPTPFEIEVPEEPSATTEIVVDPGLEDTTEFEAGEGNQTASASSWIFGFIVGFLLGGLIGRMSWGIRRKRRQQIFG